MLGLEEQRPEGHAGFQLYLLSLVNQARLVPFLRQRHVFRSKKKKKIRSVANQQEAEYYRAWKTPRKDLQTWLAIKAGSPRTPPSLGVQFQGLGEEKVDS